MHSVARMALAVVVGVAFWSPDVEATSKKSSCRTDACIKAQQQAAHAKRRAEDKAKAQAAAADLRKKQDAEIAAEKARIAKMKAEPGVTKQVCYMVAGQLQCK